VCQAIRPSDCEGADDSAVCCGLPA
jgi:hypothetical protein